MDLTIHVQDATEDFAREVLAMFAGAEGVTVATQEAPDTVWTADRAYRLLRHTNTRVQLFMSQLVQGDGWLDAYAYREKWGQNSLRGPSAALTKAIKRGAKEGWWSPDIPNPVRPTTPDPQKGWSKTAGYYLDEEHLPAFRAAWERRVHENNGRGPRLIEDIDDDPDDLGDKA
ncbi:hypothetical protein AB0N99_15880 [Streptomyces sp. NPDC093272]|jgi:hypothetical protein|uniref:hypothetical protein n=1 Tax=Streptomyces TaxID=1883 RepID=UPI00342B0CF8